MQNSSTDTVYYKKAETVKFFRFFQKDFRNCLYAGIKPKGEGLRLHDLRGLSLAEGGDFFTAVAPAQTGQEAER